MERKSKIIRDLQNEVRGTFACHHNSDFILEENDLASYIKHVTVVGKKDTREILWTEKQMKMTVCI